MTISVSMGWQLNGVCTIDKNCNHVDFAPFPCYNYGTSSLQPFLLRIHLLTSLFSLLVSSDRIALVTWSSSPLPLVILCTPRFRIGVTTILSFTFQSMGTALHTRTGILYARHVKLRLSVVVVVLQDVFGSQHI